jgi:hypothetical protein
VHAAITITRGGTEARKIGPKNVDGAANRIENTRKQSQERGLAGSTRSVKKGALPTLDVEPWDTQDLGPGSIRKP